MGLLKMTLLQNIKMTNLFQFNKCQELLMKKTEKAAYRDFKGRIYIKIIQNQSQN